jgi:hypothetical protein
MTDADLLAIILCIGSGTIRQVVPEKIKLNFRRRIFLGPALELSHSGTKLRLQRSRAADLIILNPLWFFTTIAPASDESLRSKV